MQTLPDTCAKQVTAYNTVASGNTCGITLNAVAGNYHILDWLSWSYAADPTNGAITITDTTNNTVLMSVDVTAGGPGEFMFGDRGFPTLKATALKVLMADGSQTKKLTIQYR